MERCPICKEMTAEKNHYTGKIVCFNRFCRPAILDRPKDKKKGKGKIHRLYPPDRRSS